MEKGCFGYLAKFYHRIFLLTPAIVDFAGKKEDSREIYVTVWQLKRQNATTTTLMTLQIKWQRTERKATVNW